MLIAAFMPLLCSLEATGIRSRAVAIYQALETPRLRISVDTSTLASRIEGPPDATSWSLARDGGARPAGTEILVLRWEGKDGGTVGQARLQLRLRSQEWTPFAKLRMQRGQRPDSTELRWAWTEATTRTPQAPDPRDLGFLRLRTGAGADQPLRMGAWEPVPAVVPGQKLTIVSRHAGATATIDGSAQGTAVVGGTVRVLTPFGRRILCRIQPDGSALALD
ncbi:MAG: flagella basal body P-ring formation protein FlgA [Fibrobacteres bacterium]|jgi:hypothetical protein|nr:flagella basal body P-ring formation protein FlgA [Fibrobacterota bacterium]